MTETVHLLLHKAGKLFQGTTPVVVILVIAFWKPRLGSMVFHPLERLLAKLARRRALAITAVGLFSFMLCAAFSLFVRMPVPCVHDEFAHLLAADTFLHGRLTNPPHPMWIHFETFHVLFQPTYASMYPPGQGLILALGKLLTGLPIAGAWLSTALASASLCWMLMAWYKPRWALLGGILAAIHPMLFNWSQSFWGGSLTVCGGALLMGAWRRVMDRPNMRDSLLMGLGMAVLANTRPFEGMILSLLAACGLLIWMANKSGPSLVTSLRYIVLPLFLVLALLACWTGYYNRRVTGSVFVMPELLSKQRYAFAPVFFWQHRNPVPAYHHKAMEDFYTHLELEPYERQHTLRGLASETKNKAVLLAKGFFMEPGFFPFSILKMPLWIPFVILVATLPWIWKERRLRGTVLIGCLFVLAVLQITWVFVHYAAPATAVLFVVAMQGLRHVRQWRWRARPSGPIVPSGLFVMRASVVLCFAAFVFECFDINRAYTAWKTEAVQRSDIISRLQREGGHHLILVRYAPDHVSHREWVYNEADIDHAKVVWARDMGEERNRELIDYFKDRRFWLLEADAEHRHLVPYQDITAGGADRKQERE